MRKILFVIFILSSLKSISQFEKVLSGTVYIYKYTNAVTSNGGDTEDTLSKKVYTYVVKVDTVILFNKGQSRFIVFDKIIDPFLNYKGDNTVNQKQTIYYIKNGTIFSLRINTSDLKRRMQYQNFVDRVIEVVSKRITKTEYKVGEDLNNFEVDGITVDFFPFIKIRKNEANASNPETSYTGYIKFYKYSSEKKIKNNVTSEVGQYQKNDFLRKTDATVNFSPTYGLITSSAYIISGEKNNVFKLELLKLETPIK